MNTLKVESKKLLDITLDLEDVIDALQALARNTPDKLNGELYLSGANTLIGISHTLNNKRVDIEDELIDLRETTQED